MATTNNRKSADLLTVDFKESIDWHLDRGHRLIRLNKYASNKDPKQPVNKGWREDKGLTQRQAYKAVRDGYNIGWAPTGEHLIIDVDMHGKDGLATYDKFKKILPNESLIPRVNSSRGGFHLYLRKGKDDRVTAVNLKKQFGGGVDIIANVQVVIPASIHPVTGLPYEFVNMPDEIPYWTPQLKELLSPKKKKRSAASDSSDELPDIRAVEHILSAIPNDDMDYDEWFATGCAIHKSTEGSEEGCQLFHDWSAQCSKYDEDYTDAKWESIGNYGGEMRGFGSLVVEAREHDPQLVSNVVHKLNHTPPELDFADLPPPDKTFDISKRHWRLNLVSLESQLARPDEFYYQDVLPKGAYALMAGRQGTGKSSLLMKIAACFTTGEVFPGDENNPLIREPGDVLYFSEEERINESVVPKLRQAGADMKRFFHVPAQLVRERREGGEEVRGFSITEGLSYLEAAIKQLPNCKFVIFDPILMFIVAHDANDSSTMNQALAPLNRLAAKYDLCILGVTHFNKAGGRGFDKVMGSVAHTSVARHVTFLMKHYVDDQTILATSKSNMFTTHTSYIFRGVELEPEYVEGYATPLRQREMVLVEHVTEKRTTDDWERIIEADLAENANSERTSALDHTIGQIVQWIHDESLQTHYWPSVEFKQIVIDKFAKHVRTYTEACERMVATKMLAKENVGGTWWVWHIDGLISDDEQEVEDYNRNMRERILSEHGTTSTLVQDDIYEFVNDAFPNRVSYDEVHQVMHELGHTERSTDNAIRVLIKRKKVERIHTKRRYYLAAY